MMRRTHAAAGLLIGIGLISVHPSDDILMGLFTVGLCEVSALLPDLDIPLGLKHRGLTHSLIALLIIGFLGQHFLPADFLLPILFGYSSHLFLDSLTRHGIPIFYPFKVRLRISRFRTGGLMDDFLYCLLMMSAVLMFLLTTPGFHLIMP